ncbi:MAG: sigma-70 family RNA polymerase sigma factor [Bradyrhizobiaceae bacterium]|nr:sigma-70 family RNA polymerase sigma factor [Hyphomicrobiales bacterium]MBV9429971.1 sigma-70 family RNA polymerase sigma factor [Bradyrhizobiaceae bacterium]
MSTAAVLRPEVWHQGRGPAPRPVPAPPRTPERPRANGGPVTGQPGGDDRTRFAAVVQPNLDDAFALARWLTGNRTDAEDVVQEACLRAYRAIGTFAGGNARAWVLTIVRHTAYTWLRRNRSASLVMVDDLEAVERAHADPGDQEKATPETELIAKADAARLESAIADLPAPFKETLVLRDVQGLDYREIAQITEVPIGTVMSRLARARRRLVARLTKD